MSIDPMLEGRNPYEQEPACETCKCGADLVWVETGWLLDDGLLCIGACFGGFKLVTYTDNSAIRFAREQDAAAAIVGLKCLSYPHAFRVKPMEHSWG